MTEVDYVQIDHVVDGWWRIAAGWDPMWCPDEPLPGLADTLAGQSVQLLELDQGISESQNIDPWTSIVGVDSHDECAAWANIGSITVFDPVDRDQVPVPDFVTWLE